MKRLGFAYNPTQDSALELRERAIGWCQVRRIDAWAVPASETDENTERLAHTDAVVVLGGDGTFLHAARAAATADIPILGINSGKVGFLSKAEQNDLEDVLGILVDGDYEFEPRMMLDATVIDGSGARSPRSYMALNEAAVVRGASPRVVRGEVKVGGSHVATYICDGIVVASPTGSTGYSFSAGGPVLDPTSRNLVVTPIAAYLSALRSSVVGAHHTVRVTVEAAHDCLVSIDGREDIPLAVGDAVEVRAREAPIRFIQPRGAVPFWDLVRQKAQLLPR